jgi:NAD dependent epimerase/dehydratase family enzyme
MGKAMLLEGQRVVPGKLLETGFRFETPYLAEALRWELGEVADA